MTPKQQSTVSRARELLAKITPYPWEWSYHPEMPDAVMALEQSRRSDVWLSKGGDVLLCTGAVSADGAEITFGEIAPPDADFIAAAPELVSALADENDKLRDALKTLALKDNCWCPIAHWWKSPEGIHSQRCLDIRAALNDPKTE